MWELDYKESWVLKNCCFWTVVLEKTLESPLDCKEIQQSILKVISCAHSLEGLMVKLKCQYFSHVNTLDAKNWFIWKDPEKKNEKKEKKRKDPDAGKDWRQEEKGMTEDKMVGWHHLTQWTWVLVNSESWQWTGRPGMLQSMKSQRVGHDWATDLNWHCLSYCSFLLRLESVNPPMM